MRAGVGMSSVRPAAIMRRRLGRGRIHNGAGDGDEFLGVLGGCRRLCTLAALADRAQFLGDLAHHGARFGKLVIAAVKHRVLAERDQARLLRGEGCRIGVEQDGFADGLERLEQFKRQPPIGWVEPAHVVLVASGV
jgi:hypothetical protein